MRIALLFYGNLNFLTGGFLYDRLLKDFIQKKGDELDLFSLPWKHYVSGLLDNPFLTPRSLSRGKRYDLIIEDALAHPSLLRFNLEMKCRIRCPILSLVHSLYANLVRHAWKRAILRRIEGLYFKSVDGLVFNSQATRMDAEEAAKTKLNGVVAYPGGDRLGSGLSEEEIVKRAMRPGPLEILFAGSLTRHKGLHILLDALDRLSSSTDGSWRLTVAGNEWIEPSYVTAIRSRVEQRWSGKVRLIGNLGPVEMANCFSKSHLLVVPSAYEGFGMAYIEGMAFGLPAIASNTGGAKEVIRNEENGFLINPGDARSLSQHIGLLANQREYLIKLSLNAKKSHSIHPSWDMSLSKIYSFCENLYQENPQFLCSFPSM